MNTMTIVYDVDSV